MRQLTELLHQQCDGCCHIAGFSISATLSLGRLAVIAVLAARLLEFFDRSADSIIVVLEGKWIQYYQQMTRFVPLHGEDAR